MGYHDRRILSESDYLFPTSVVILSPIPFFVQILDSYTTNEE